jgi:DNA repair protein SbcD/Mre11
MKIIHCADLHLDSPLTTNLTQEKIKERKNEILNSFKRLVEFASENNVRVILIAGDLFDDNNVNRMTKEFVLNLIDRNKNIDFLYLSGNHDNNNFFSDLKLPDNLKIFGNSWSSFKYDNVNIVGQNINNDIMYSTLNLDKKDKNIVVLHGDINSEINIKKLKDKNIDYLALGHIHKYEEGKIDYRGNYVYSGCLEGRGFDECDEKGFVLIDTDNALSYKFVPFSLRKLHYYQIDLTDKKDWYKEVLVEVYDKLKDISSKDLIYIEFIGKFNEGLSKQIELLQTELNEKFYFVKIVDSSSLKVELKDYKNDISLKAEFIALVKNDETLSEEQKNKILEIGINALDEKENKN